MQINFRPAETFRGTRILRQADNLAYAYETEHAAADADGAPNAYHPDDLNKNCTRDPHVGLDCLANAGYPRTSWWKDVLVPDPADPSKAFAQTSGPFRGFFVAMTSLRKPGGNKLDTSTYVDATKVPYVVIPTGFGSLAHVAKQGDVGIATHLENGKMTTFIVADSGGGSDAKLGESSIALFVALGGQNPNPRTGAGLPRGKIQYIIFPGSRRAAAAIWPRTNEDIHAQAMELASRTPGIEPEAVELREAAPMSPSLRGSGVRMDDAEPSATRRLPRRARKRRALKTARKKRSPKAAKKRSSKRGKIRATRRAKQR